MTLIIENAELSVTVTPAYGARVTSLIAKASGREWMTQGSPSPNTGEGAIYSGAEAVGWDECFPTVGACDARDTTWRRRMRDHGDLWGRPWAIDSIDPERVTLSYASPLFVFTRTLTLNGPNLVAAYTVENRNDEHQTYLWALHALLAVHPDDRIELPGVETVRSTYMALGGQMLPVGDIGWRGANGQLPFNLDQAQPASTNFAAKFIATGIPGGTARIGQPGRWLTIAWDESIRDLGIWLTYGAWPTAGGHYEVALEPQSAPADDLNQAIVSGTKALAPGEKRHWQVVLTVGQ